MAKINKTDIYKISDKYKSGIILGSDMDNNGTTVNFSIQGIKEFVGAGTEGKSAYQVAVEEGFQGTEEEWLESLKVKGDDGRSAYDVAVDEGFEGTEEEWIISLKGQKGDKGDTGYKTIDPFPVKISDTAPTVIGWYKPQELGVYPNLENQEAVQGYDTLFYFDGEHWRTAATKTPLDPVGVIELNNLDAVNGDKIFRFVEEETAIPKALFYEGQIDKGFIQKTAIGSVANTGVTTVHGLSASIGIASTKFNKIKVSFAQNIATPVTQIEVRLFQGKTVGGALITKKRQTFTASTSVQTVFELTFNSIIEYTGEMWIQILMNNPFAYKRVSPAVLRTAALGYGPPAITTVNNLDGTTFSTSQGYTDIFVEFNSLEDAILLTDTGNKTISTSVTEDTEINLTGEYLDQNSYIDLTGNVIPSGNWRTSKVIPVVSGTEYKYKGRTNQSNAAIGMVGYKADSSKVILVGNSDYWTSPLFITIPPDIMNVQICGFFDTPPTLTITESKIKKSLIPDSEETAGKIVVDQAWHAVGHSIWAQDSVPYPNTTEPNAIGIQTLVRRIFKFKQYNRYAYSGRSLAATPDPNDPTGTNNPNDTLSITNYFNTWTDTTNGFWTYDSITNDFRRDIPIGLLSDYENNTGNLTYYGALRQLRDKIYSLTPDAKVIAFNALKRNNAGYTSTSANAKGFRLADYEKAIMTVCKINGWRFVDQFRKSEIEDDTLSITTNDGLHPNDFGYRLVYKLVVDNIWLHISEFE